MKRDAMLKQSNLSAVRKDLKWCAELRETC